MKVAALTMVYRDHWFLSRWIEHYGRHFGRSNLFIVSHGNERPIRKIAGDANVIGIVRETSGDFDVMRWGFLNDILRILLKSYDCVVIGDVDELIVPNPRFGTDLVTELGRKADAPVSFVTGMELVEQKDDRPIGENEKLLVQRRSGIWNWLYTKAAIVYEPVRIGRGAHFAWHTPYYNAENLLLFHLKFANSALFADILESRADIRKPGSDGKTRTPGAMAGEVTRWKPCLTSTPSCRLSISTMAFQNFAAAPDLTTVSIGKPVPIASSSISGSFYRASLQSCFDEESPRLSRRPSHLFRHFGIRFVPVYQRNMTGVRTLRSTGQRCRVSTGGCHQLSCSPSQ